MPMGGITYTECLSLITDAVASLCSRRNEGKSALMLQEPKL